MFARRKPEPKKPDPLDTAWRIHAAVVDWTGKVDTKASFSLTLESALLLGVVALFQKDRRLNVLQDWWTTSISWAGIGALIMSVFLSASVVAPRLRGGKTRKEAARSYVYFGHLRHWEPADLERELRTGDPLPVLSRQLVNMSKIAWQKHRRVQVSMGLAALGAVLVAVGSAMNG